jgi:hypothetical protein
MRRKKHRDWVFLALVALSGILLVVVLVGYSMRPAPWPFSLIWSDDVPVRARQLVSGSFAFFVFSICAGGILVLMRVASARRTAHEYDRRVRAWPPVLRRGSERWVLIGFLPGVTISWPLLPDYVPILRNGLVFGGVVLGATVVAGVSFFRLVIMILVRARRHGYSICPNCGYSLKGLASSSTCPECSKAYDLRIARRQWKFWYDRSLTLRAHDAITRMTRPSGLFKANR